MPVAANKNCQYLFQSCQ